MPLVQIKGISGYLSLPQKQEIIRKVTDAVLSVVHHEWGQTPLIKLNPAMDGCINSSSR